MVLSVKSSDDFERIGSQAGAREVTWMSRVLGMFIAKKNNAPADAATLLNSRRVPARLHSSEVAGMLGFQDHDIPVLVVARLLIPLGKPAANAPKYFALVDVLAAGQDREWLAQATRVLTKYWRDKNSRKRISGGEGDESGQ